MTERRCRWCNQTEGEIVAFIEANGLKRPARIFNRADAWCPCILCRAAKRKLTASRNTDAAPHEQTVMVHRRGLQRRHGTDNRSDER